MARVNVEDDVEARPEYRKLLKLLGGDDDRALGMLVRFWRHAQRLWGQGQLVPVSDMAVWGWEPHIESRWAVIRDGGVYAIGAEDRFAWYRQRVDAGKSRAAGQRNEAGQFLANENLAYAVTGQRAPTGSPPAIQRKQDSHQPPTLTPVLAPTKKQEKNSVGSEVAKAPPPEAGLPGRRLIGEYVNAYKRRYGENTRPEITGKTAGQAKELLRTTPVDRACQLVQVYLQMNDKWFETKCHDFSTFIENLTKVGLALDTGQNPGGVDWAKLEAQTRKALP